MSNTDEFEVARQVAHFLQQARERASITKKDAAAVSGMSEGRWRQLEKGTETKKGVTHAVTTKAETLVAVALAVQADPDELLRIAGKNTTADEVLRDADPTERPDGEPSMPVPHVLDVSDLTEVELARVEGFILGLRASRN